VDGEMGIGNWGYDPIPKPNTPTPHPQSPIPINE